MSKPVKIQVLVRLKEGVLDVQGKAIETGLKDSGIEGVGGITVGRLIEFEVNGKSPADVRLMAEELCRKVLANPVIERFEIKEII